MSITYTEQVCEPWRHTDYVEITTERRKLRSDAAMGAYGQYKAAGEELKEKWYKEMLAATEGRLELIADRACLAPFIKTLLETKQWQSKPETIYTYDGFTDTDLTPNMTRILMNRGLLVLPRAPRVGKPRFCVLRFPWMRPKRS